MAVRVVGVSLPPELLEGLDDLAAEEATSRSGMLARLVEGELGRRKGRRLEPVVTVDGVRFVRARGGGRAAR